ncbi:MAG: hypothetical protein PHG06_00555 [Parabacteroides sp.]|nr:hypothetical protein [Parabacteroides sp.]
MTKGTKGVSGFQRVIQPEDIKTVLDNAETPLKNSQVRDELVMLKPEIYGKRMTKNAISIDGVKRALLKMQKIGEISGGMNKGLGCYLWVKKED